MKTTLCLLALVGVAAGCRVSRLGDQQVVRNAFAAQAQQRSAPPSELDAADAHAIMARHREPLAPSQAAGGPGQRVLESPQLGPTTGTVQP